MTRLSGKACVVTGSSGMAADAVRRLVKEGARVLAVGRDEQELRGLGVDHVLADLADEDDTVRAFAAARDLLGRIDGVYAVAGASGRRVGDGPLHELTAAAWRSTFELNALPAFLTAREAVRAMLEQDAGDRGHRGSLVLMSSVLAFHPAPALFATHAYAASKSSVIGLMHAAAAYYATDGIRVNVVAPSLVTTPMAARAASDAAAVAFSRSRQPLTDGFLDPSDVTDAVVYLLSDESRALSGQVVVVDGGWTLRTDR